MNPNLTPETRRRLALGLVIAPPNRNRRRSNRRAVDFRSIAAVTVALAAGTALFYLLSLRAG